MKMGRFINRWTIGIFLLLAVIIAGSAVIWTKNTRDHEIEISITPEREIAGRIWVGGAVNNPGLYPLYAGDDIGDIIRAAGGIKDGADLSSLELTVSEVNNGVNSQKVNINMAEAWLLEALPGIGESRAQAIIEYRLKNGPFRDIYELVKVPGLGEENFAKIKNLITVND